MTIGNSGATAAAKTEFPLCSLAKKVPKAKKTNNPDTDGDNIRARSNLIKMLNVLDVFPQLSKDACDFVQGKAELLMIGKADDSLEFTEGISTLGKTDKDWVAGFIALHTPITKMMLEQFAQTEKRIAINIFLYLLHAASGTSWLEECVAKKVRLSQQRRV